ncbi:hypothetical protein GN958_ATG09987 [Phytophthora infestans]|uniref:Uncharacterized protein n=1 Tax=Phytophthora infestans TaxID=4787 RepID=A0A8S9UP29_PHYIN|nr:hypothetical protein GN958_ATG09987 [Phytophthora infestans]
MERQEYDDAIEARCATTGEDKSKALRSVKNSFNRQLLKTLCKFERGTTVEKITEDRILSELDKIIGKVMPDAIPDIDSIFDVRLKMDLDQRDIKARVLNYFMLMRSFWKTDWRVPLLQQQVLRKNAEY